MKIEQIIKVVEDRGVSIFRMTSAFLSEEVIELTPRLSGSLVNSWTPNNGPPIARNVNIDVNNPWASRVNFSSVVNSLKLGDTYSLGNGQPYAARIEFEGHSSLKAPAGMLMVTLSRLQVLTDGAVRGSRT